MGAPKGTKPWNAGTGKGWVDDRGYRWVYITLNGKRVARREHRVLMEAHLGRMLEPWEIVHHKDEDTSNNSINNLEVLEFGAHSTLHHSGGRKSRDAKKTMEVFGLLREELKRERALKADLLEAMTLFLSRMDRFGNWDDGCFYYEGRAASELQEPITLARTAIAKAL